MKEKAQLRLISLVGWATMRERGGASSSGVDIPGRRSAILHVSYLESSVERAPPVLEAKSYPPGPQHHLTCP
jgi:hypothetical protein